MTKYTLTVVDTSRIQDYIFGSNNLKQNSGASYLVDQATRHWLVDALAGMSHNVNDIDHPVAPFRPVAIEQGGLDAEVIYAGGGNTRLIFANRALAIKFTRRLTRRTLLEAPGLRLNLAHEDFDWSKPLGDRDGQPGVIATAMARLERQKRQQMAPQPLAGLGVSAACVFTGLPAVTFDADDGLMSAEAQAKHANAAAAHKRLREFVDFGHYIPARDFDDLGRTEGESSYIAVVHADGNSVGKRIQRFVAQAADNRRYIENARSFSQSIRQAAQKALQATVDHLIAAIDFTNGNREIGAQVTLAERADEVLLPFRPLVFGGDDMTFVCDGRLGLSLAAHYLKQYTSQPLADGEPAYCRAGVAVVKTHYPFARAYELAEQLCAEARKYIKKRQAPPISESGLSALDWHFAISGHILDLASIRAREYTEQPGSLLMRPVAVTPARQEWRTWKNFVQVAEQFAMGDAWRDRRNKVKALREALRHGPEAVRQFRHSYGLERLPVIVERPDMATQGWQGGECGYFDAIEAMDYFIALPDERTAGGN